MKHWSEASKFGMQTESTYGSTVYGMYFVCQELQKWRRCELRGYNSQVYFMQ